MINSLQYESWNIKAFTKNIIKKKIIGFILLNNPFLYSHLWFTLALLYCYILMFILYNINNKLITKSAILYFFLFFGLISYHLLTEFRNIYLINSLLKFLEIKQGTHLCFIFRALPFFIIGIIVKKNKLKPIKSSYILLYFILGSLITWIENDIFIISLNSYIGTYFQLIALISFCLNGTPNDNRIFQILSYIGRELSDKIYIYHRAARFIINLILYKNKINGREYKWFLYCRFFIELLISFYLAFIMKLIE